MRTKNTEEFSDYIKRIYCDSELNIPSITIQVCDYCSLCCTYCYQINKQNHVMNIDTAKLFIDKLLTNKDNFVMCSVVLRKKRTFADIIVIAWRRRHIQQYDTSYRS